MSDIKEATLASLISASVEIEECVVFAECDDLECEELHPIPVNDHIKKFLFYHDLSYRTCYCSYRDSSDYYCENKSVLCGGCREFVSPNHFRLIDCDGLDHPICNSYQCLKDFLGYNKKGTEITTESEINSDNGDAIIDNETE